MIHEQPQVSKCPQCGARFAKPVRLWVRPIHGLLLYCPECHAKIGGAEISSLSDSELQTLLDREGVGNKGKIASALRREILRRARRKHARREKAANLLNPANTLDGRFADSPGLPWMCDCGHEIGPPEMPRETARKLLLTHKEAAHSVALSETREALEDSLSAQAALNEIAPSAGQDRGIPNRTVAQNIPVHQLPFRLLPPGTWTPDQVVAHYRRMLQNSPAGLSGRKLDKSRIEKICWLAPRPSTCWIGEKAWDGYHVFEFANSDRVVLDCPFEGNAIYILWGNWKEMISCTKGEIRREFRNFHEWIPHKGNWLGRVRAALRQRQQQANRIVSVKAKGKPSGSASA